MRATTDGRSLIKRMERGEGSRSLWTFVQLKNDLPKERDSDQPTISESHCDPAMLPLYVSRIMMSDSLRNPKVELEFRKDSKIREAGRIASARIWRDVYAPTGQVK